MSNLRTVFRIARIVGLLAILALLLRSEWRFIHAHLPHALNPRVHLYAALSLLLVPLFWVSLVLAFVGQLGKWIVERKMQKAVPEE